MNYKDFFRKNLFLLFLVILVLVSGIIFYILWYSSSVYVIDLFNYDKVLIMSNLVLYFRKLSFLLLIALIFHIVYEIVRLILKKIYKNLQEEKKYVGVSRTLKFFIWFLYIIIFLSVLVGNLASLITSVGLIGFGLTLALQKPILNFVGWLTIRFKEVYTEGDRIQVGTVRGDVKEVNMMNTVLDGLIENSDIVSGKITTFPNEFVLTQEVRNFTKDNNYLLQILEISITYESNYRKAMSLLESIVTKIVKENKNSYIKTIKDERKRIDQFVKKLLKKSQLLEKNEKKSVELEADKLNKEKELMEGQLKDLEDEFKPNIRIEMADSAIILIAQFQTPYNQIKKIRTDINLAFLDMSRKEKDIEIAYPHLEIINHKK